MLILTKKPNSFVSFKFILRIISFCVSVVVITSNLYKIVLHIFLYPSPSFGKFINKPNKILLKLISYSRLNSERDTKNDEFFVLDSAHILPQDIIEYLDRDKWDIYYLGYPNTTAEDKIEEIKKYTKGGWTNKKTKEELLGIFKILINTSDDIKNTCVKNNIKFIDTSNNDVLKIFKD